MPGDQCLDQPRFTEGTDTFEILYGGFNTASPAVRLRRPTKQFLLVRLTKAGPAFCLRSTLPAHAQ